MTAFWTWSSWRPPPVSSSAFSRLRPRPRAFAFGAIAFLSFVTLAWLSDPGGPGLLVSVREFVPMAFALVSLAPLGWILLAASVVRLPWAVASYVLPGIIVALIEARLFVADLPWSVVYVALWPWFSLGVAQFFGFELGR